MRIICLDGCAEMDVNNRLAQLCNEICVKDMVTYIPTEQVAEILPTLNSNGEPLYIIGQQLENCAGIDGMKLSSLVCQGDNSGTIFVLWCKNIKAAKQYFQINTWTSMKRRICLEMGNPSDFDQNFVGTAQGTAKGYRALLLNGGVEAFRAYDLPNEDEMKRVLERMEAPDAGDNR